MITIPDEHDAYMDFFLSASQRVTTDWVSRDDVRAKLRSTIKRLLAKYGYPPDAADRDRPCNPSNGDLC